MPATACGDAGGQRSISSPTTASRLLRWTASSTTGTSITAPASLDLQHQSRQFRQCDIDERPAFRSPARSPDRNDQWLFGRRASCVVASASMNILEGPASATTGINVTGTITGKTIQLLASSSAISSFLDSSEASPRWSGSRRSRRGARACRRLSRVHRQLDGHDRQRRISVQPET